MESRIRAFPVSRRLFLGLVTAMAMPRCAWAQPAKSSYRLGWLGTNELSFTEPYSLAFVHRLDELGFVEGKNLSIAYRHAAGKVERFPSLTTELVERGNVQFPRDVAERCRYRREDPARGQGERDPDGAADDLRACDRHEDRPGSRHQCPAVDTIAPRSGVRMTDVLRSRASRLARAGRVIGSLADLRANACTNRAGANLASGCPARSCQHRAERPRQTCPGDRVLRLQDRDASRDRMRGRGSHRRPR